MSAVTALDWYRHHVDTRPVLPTGPVGPDLAAGLPPTSFFDDAFDDVLQSDGLMVAWMLDDPVRSPLLPVLAVIELEGENQARADLAGLPNYNERHDG